METRRRLVVAAAEMFDRKGYASATLSDIARVAQVTKGALYFHFASKGDLAEAVQAAGSELLRDAVRRHRGHDNSPLQTLIDVTHWLATALRQEPTVRANFRLSRERDGRRPVFTDFHQRWLSLTSSLLEQARRAGELRVEAGHLGPHTLVASAVCGIEALADTDMPEVELTERVSALWGLLLPGLAADADHGRLRTSPPS
ncbi:TetR family transcriptional regulator [Streptomyces durbertensis]|uniref:TetR family transcriptional regulator n=1 Tax=Streptomyces durbertensis TaxID=2448886 RepID=A0ABR6E9T8_9ACTN|nr:ScbR family autoregulator-binding transcription factor [Streptomyces durbertensis]MBB1242003.1 TetR family transcriptional regulator [Streptomyces durbertensis]